MPAAAVADSPASVRPSAGIGYSTVALPAALLCLLRRSPSPLPQHRLCGDNIKFTGAAVLSSPIALEK